MGHAPSPETDLALDYLTLRKAIGVLGFLLPIALLVGGALLFGLPQEPTISHYYGTPMRDVFVGLLWALGVFLFAYRGYGPTDLYASRVAGVASILVALFPHDGPATLLLGVKASTVHVAAATVFFVTLGLMSMLLFTKSSEPKEDLPKGKRRRNAVYVACGWGMLGCVALIALRTVWPQAPVLGVAGAVFWLESVAVWLFGISWYVKGEALQGGLSPKPVKAFFSRGEPAANPA